MNTLNQNNNKYMIHEQFIQFLANKLYHLEILIFLK